jgi:beta-glucosidase/6-phospho-beta-glucosidase/beta-galactosidase
MTLREIGESIKDIFDMIEENEGQYDDDMLLEAWEAMDEELEAKVNAWCRVIKDFASHEKSISEEIDRLKKRRDALRKKQMRMKDTLYTELKAVGKEKMKTAFYTVYGLKENGKLDYESGLIGDEYRIEYTSKKIDEKAIRAALENGESVEGAKLYNSLTIR